MTKQDKKRLAFVREHRGWKIKLDKFLQEPPVPELSWAPTEIDFVRYYTMDIDRTIAIVKARVSK